MKTSGLNVLPSWRRLSEESCVSLPPTTTAIRLTPTPTCPPARVAMALMISRAETASIDTFPAVVVILPAARP